jgi:tetratricopeptide (TPR) repeat protein
VTQRSNLVVLLAVFFLLASGSSQSDAKLYFENGMNSLKKKDYIRAIGDFTNAIGIKPDFGDAYFQRASAKNLLADQMGFTSNESCYDMVKALSLGIKEASGPIEKNCMGECFNIKNALSDPEAVLCADFSSKLLYDLPENADKMKNVVRLSLFNNRLTALTPKFEKLSSLVHLDLSSNKIEDLGVSIAALKNLTEIQLNKNEISELPYEFGNLDNLNSLFLRNNQITNMPKSIARLKNLQRLDLAFNKITALPLEIANLKQLKELTLVGNEISNREQAKIKALVPPTCKVYFE